MERGFPKKDGVSGKGGPTSTVCPPEKGPGRLIFMTGGVVSSIGKGLAAASLAALLRARGFTVALRKLDPYLNVDPGTMSPYQHGEVFVTDDGAETDLDLGHYERFTGRAARSRDSLSAGRVYADLLASERRGDLLGATVQVVPHVTNAIRAAMLAGIRPAPKGFEDEDGGGEDPPDFTLVEIGGTIGDIEGQPFLEAARQTAQLLGPDRAAFIHLTLVPWIAAAGELKTKPTQHSVREMRAAGIQPDILLLRADREIPKEDRAKIAMFCNVPESRVIQAQDVDTIYAAPLSYHKEGLDDALLDRFGLSSPPPDLRPWEDLVSRLRAPEWTVRIAVVGKYVKMKDAYKSLVEALAHGGAASNVGVEIDWVEGEDVEDGEALRSRLSAADGVLVPGGFGSRGVEGKIAAIGYARRRGLPFLGICLGMQLAVVEAARSAGLEGASSTEFGPTPHPVVAKMVEWEKDGISVRRDSGDLGGTMRLGAYPAVLEPDSLSASLYGTDRISERHRHRYEVGSAYEGVLGEDGLRVVGWSPDKTLPEVVERPDHPWFVAVQFHPEFKSRPLDPHPLFKGFVAAALRRSRLV